MSDGLKKSLTEKDTWYKESEKDDKNSQIPTRGAKRTTARNKGRGIKRKLVGGDENKELEIQKIVKKSETRLEYILTGSDTWKRANCNCFLCNTKTLTGQILKQYCTKQNIMYEIRYLTCEETERQRIIETYEDEEKRDDRKHEVT